MSIKQVKCRARIQIAGLVVDTPYVQSFSVQRRRGQISTFDASLKAQASAAASLAGGDVKIWAGEGSPSNLIFTGMCKMAKISPCYDDPAYVMISISGQDKLSLLEGKKFTRRCRSTNSAWCAITGIVRKGLKSGKFAYSSEPVISLEDGKSSGDREMSGTRNMNAVDSSSPGKVPNPKSNKTVHPIVAIENVNANDTGGA
jgi:hypothetical protein